MAERLLLRFGVIENIGVFQQTSVGVFGRVEDYVLVPDVRFISRQATNRGNLLDDDTVEFAVDFGALGPGLHHCGFFEQRIVFGVVEIGSVRTGRAIGTVKQLQRIFAIRIVQSHAMPISVHSRFLTALL